MSINLVSTAHNNTNTQTLTISKPSGGWLAGNVLVACVCGEGTGNSDLTPPAGWTQLDVDNTYTFSHSYYHVCGASEPASYSWTSSNSTSDAFAACILEYSGVNNTTPINVHSIHAFSSADKTITWDTATTTTVNGCKIVAFGAVECKNVGPTVATPTGFTSRVSDNSVGLASDNFAGSVFAWDEDQATAGTLPNLSAAITTPSQPIDTYWAGYYVVLAPSGDSTTSLTGVSATAQEGAVRSNTNATGNAAWDTSAALQATGPATNLTRAYVTGAQAAAGTIKELVTATNLTLTLNGSAALGSDADGDYLNMPGHTDSAAIADSFTNSGGKFSLVIVFKPAAGVTLTGFDAIGSLVNSGITDWAASFGTGSAGTFLNISNSQFNAEDFSTTAADAGTGTLRTFVITWDGVTTGSGDGAKLYLDGGSSADTSAGIPSNGFSGTVAELLLGNIGGPSYAGKVYFIGYADGTEWNATTAQAVANDPKGQLLKEASTSPGPRGVSSSTAAGTVTADVQPQPAGVHATALAGGLPLPSITTSFGATGVSTASQAGVVTSNLVLDLTGQAATAQEGVLVLEHDLNPTGVSSGAAFGTLGLDVSSTLSLTGVSSTTAAGIVLRETLLSSQVVQVRVGTLGVDLSPNISLTSAFSAGQAGTLTEKAGPLLGSVQVVGAAGLVGPSLSRALLGEVTTVGIGRVVNTHVPAPVGVQAQGTVGTLSTILSPRVHPLGVATTTNAGVLAKQLDAVVIGVYATIEAGTPQAIHASAPVGVVATSQVGSVLAARSLGVVGQSTAARTGVFVLESYAGALGRQTAGQAGTLRSQSDITITGEAAQALASRVGVEKFAHPRGVSANIGLGLLKLSSTTLHGVYADAFFGRFATRTKIGLGGYAGARVATARGRTRSTQSPATMFVAASNARSRNVQLVE